ncbi:MAG: agmatinase [bacterium]|nr:agmatinase [bacterium]
MRRLHNQHEQFEPGTLTVVGIPSDENSSFLRGVALAPNRIREALLSGASNLCAEDGSDLSQIPQFVDVGDLDLPFGEVWDTSGSPRIEAGISKLLNQGARVISLGGDHAVTYPIIKAYAAHYPQLNILHLDAHPDLYDELDGNRFSHACPFARIMEEKLAARLVQVGIRTLNQHQRQQANRFSVEIIEMRDWHQGMTVEFDGPVYLSLDLDALDPAYAPGVSHHEPGGFTTRDVLHIIQNLNAPLVGADIVELNPTRDLVGITAVTAAKFLKEIATKMLNTKDYHEKT